MKIINLQKVTDTRLGNSEVTWEEMVQRLTTRYVTPDDEATYLELDKGQQLALKSANGGYVGGRFPEDGKAYRRKASNIAARSLVTLDFDCPVEFDPKCTYVKHTTHGHRQGNERWRYVLPLAREVSPVEYQAVARYVTREVIDKVDPTCFDVSHLMFYPTTPRDGEFISYLSPYDHFLDPDMILEQYGDQFDNPQKWTFSPKEKEEREVLKKAYRSGTLMQNPRDKGGIVGAWCRTYDCYDVLAMFPHLYARSTQHPNRFTYHASQGQEGAILYDGGLFFYSHHGSDPLNGKELNAFDLCRHLMFGDLDRDTPKKDPNRPPSLLPSNGTARTTGQRDTPRVRQRTPH